MLKNLRLRYDAVEDRITMRLTMQPTGEAAVDHSLHLTRRMCAAWRLDLQAALDLSAEAPASTAPSTKAAISNAHHEAMAGQAKVRTEVAEQEPEPDIPPALVTKIVCGRRRDDAKWIVRFERRNLPSLTLQLSSTTLHGLVDALARRIKTAAWGLTALPHETKSIEPLTAGAHLH